MAGPETVPNNELQSLVQRFGNREHLLGVVIYERQGTLVAMTPGLERWSPRVRRR